MRIGRRTARGTLEYRTRDERALTEVLPSAPAAVRIYGPDGCCTALHLDLDVSRGGWLAVEADCDRLMAWLHEHGARMVTDRSPSGGRHIYVPFATRVPFEVARELVEALASWNPTLDAGPHRSLTTGCIRPPGAVHKAGGHQELTMPLAAAYDVLRRRNPVEVLEQLRAAMGAEIAAWRATQSTPDAPADLTGDSPAPAGVLSRRLQAIAVTGVYDTVRYASASEARQAVVSGAVAAGWSLAHVAVRLGDGRFPGLAAMYARYSLAQRPASLAQDWRKAQAFVASSPTRPAQSPSNDTVRRSHTSASRSRGGTPTPDEPPDEHGFIRTWRATLRCVELHRFPGRGDHLARFILRAMGEAAHKTGTRYVAFGARSLAVATGAEFSSVASVLRRLAAEENGWLDLVEPARGERADLYALTLPKDLAEAASDLRWDRGQVYALRPAFRVLGQVPAFVFEALEAGRAISITTLVPATGLSRSAVAEAVDVLCAHDLVDRTPSGLRAHPDRLRAVAERVGALEEVTEQLRNYARQRRIWHAFLTRHDADHSLTIPDDAVEAWWWPPDDADTGWTLAGVVAA